MKAWHFISNNKKLGYGDNRVVRVGQTYKYKGKEPIELCKRGMHGSVKIRDALQYAQGSIICLVEMSGEIIKGNDKVVATERKVLAMINGEKLLRKFACLCALDVIHLWDAPDIVVRYLKTQDESIMQEASARVSAWGSARDSACDSACDSAWASACDSASASASDSAWASARASARGSARASASARAEEKQNARLTRMVNKAMMKGSE